MNPETSISQKQEPQPTAPVEATRAQPVFLPCTDIYERESEMIIIAQMPGVSRETADVSLEAGELRITGRIDRTTVDGHQLAYAEYETGDYERTFRITGDIDADRIDATMKNGVLRIVLPKSKQASPQKITVKGG
jgi:HSP20 family molecular chaperone IbpA